MKDRGIQRDGFILYKSFYDPISQLTDEQLGRLFRSIYLWQINGEADPGPDIKVAFGFFINQFRIDNEKYSAKCEQYRENGRMGGRPKKTNRLSGNQSVSKKAKKADNDNENENENEKIESADASLSAGSLKRFVKPTLEEVEDYCNSRGNGVDASAFFDFYESKGWKVGNQPMKDWRASVRTWERKNSSSKPQLQPDQGREENEDIYSAYDF